MSFLKQSIILSDLSKKDTYLKRIDDYSENHCWQYDIRLNNLDKDLKAKGLTKEYVDNLKVSDFTFKNITDKKDQQELKTFIENNEWLGKLSQYTTHWFACYHKNILSGVILFNMPNAFSKILGEETKHIERLISRGACISWSPKNLASAFLMWSIKWMVSNTQYRLFTAYSDPIAKEIGTIYQACNFYYLGQNSGTKERCINPYTGKIVSDRFFRSRSAYKKYAKDLSITWGNNWNSDQSMLWENIPDEVEERLREYSKKQYDESEKLQFPLKHKYAYILGRTKKETKELLTVFKDRNKIYPYPKERGK